MKTLIQTLIILISLTISQALLAQNQDTIYYTSFEEVDIQNLSHTANTINGADNWSYTAINEGMLDFNTFQYSGKKSACLAAASANVYPNAINHLTLTVNPTAYADINLSFYIFVNSDENNENDKLWIRGDDNAEWIEVTSFQYNNIEGWQNIVIYNIEDILAANNQAISSNTQLRFGQEDNYDFLGGDGLIIDDVVLTGSILPRAETETEQQ